MSNVTTLIRKGDIEEAEAELSRMEPELGQQADWHFQRGLLCEAKGNVDDAMTAFERAVEIDENHLEAIFRLGFNHDLFGDEDRAVELFEVLAEGTPTYVNALLNLAVIYEDRGRHEEAYRCVQRVLADHPEHSRARLFLLDIQSSASMHYDEVQERSREKHDALLDTSISDFELSVRSRNCLRKMNINSLGDLLRIGEAELLSYKNFGDTSLSEIKAMLSQKSLRLGLLKEESPGSPGASPLSVARRQINEGAPGVLDKYLSEIAFSGRSRKCLQRLNLMSVRDLASKTETELLSTKNFGSTSLSEIKTKLAELGLSLRKKPD